MQQAFYSYLPGARKELKKSNTFFGTIFKRNLSFENTYGIDFSSHTPSASGS